MSTSVDIGALAAHAAEYPLAYLITITAHERIHTSVVHPEIDARGVTVPGASGKARANAGAHPEVSLVWPPADPHGYSLIVDGTAHDRAAAGDAGAASDDLTIAPTRAILHRPAAEPSAPDAGDGCTQDCIEL